MDMQTAVTAGPAARQSGQGRAFPVAVAVLTGVTWLSGALFALYILAFYLGAVPAGTPENWNAILPRLYQAGGTAANWGMGVHFALGAVLLLLGPVQLIGAIRQHRPALHRLIGRVYVTAALFTGLGGLAFIALRGTVGGPVMSVGFALYGALMVWCAAEAVRHARARRFDRHRAFAIRLYALVIGSWLYRMEYALWFLTMGETGHTEDFRGWFDAVMAFAFYLPNLAVAELVIRRPWRGRAALVLLVAASAFVALATWFFTTELWGPAIAWRLALSG